MKPSEHRAELEKFEAFREAYDELERLNADREMRYPHELYMKKIRDEEVKFIDPKVAGKIEGRAERKAEGLTEGLEKGRTEMILQIYKNGMSIEKTSDILSLPIGHVQDVIKRYQ